LRRILLAVMPLLLLRVLEQSPSAQSAYTIEGLVLEGGTDRPLERVQVSLLPGSKFATTDSTGNFSINGVPTGRYRLVPAREGFVYSRPAHLKAPREPGVWVQVSPGQKSEKIRLRMVKEGIIAGVVLTSNGRSSAGLAAALLRYSYDAYGNRKLLWASGTAAVKVDDRGRFRFFGLQPGSYIVSAGGGGLFSDTTSLYYPGTADEDQSLPVQVKAGEEVLLPTMTVHPTMKSKEVRLQFTGTARQARTTLTLNVGSSGLLEFPPDTSATDGLIVPGLAIGRYDIMVSWMTSPQDLYYGKSTLEVSDSDLTRVLEITKGVKVKGSVVFEDAKGTRTPASGVVCALRPIRFPSIPPACAGGAAVPGQYQINFQQMPADAYVLLAEVGGQDILSGPVEITADVDVNVVLVTPGSVVEGAVRDANGDKLADAVVALVPDAPLRFAGPLYRSVISDVNGNFELRGIAPGSYRLFAWTELEGAAYRNAEFMKEFDDRGKPISIEKAARVSIDVTVF